MRAGLYGLRGNGWVCGGGGGESGVGEVGG